MTATGVKPIALEQWSCESFWLYGVVDPLLGWQFCQEYPQLNSTHFQSFIDAVSQQLGRERAVLQLNRAKAHQALALRWPDNLIPVLQPPYSPELNPIERQVAPSTQNQAFSALLFLYREVCQRDTNWNLDAERAAPKRYLPTVLTQEEEF